MTPLHAHATGRKLLLVDDDRLILTTMASALTSAGYVVTVAESADEAEDGLMEGHWRPDLVILDVQMPGRDGLTLAQRLRDLEHIPFMMLSAYGDSATVARATQQGALSYAVKPIDAAQLIPAIEVALARANDLKDLRTVRQQLQTALDSERDINVAVGIIMTLHRQTRKAAFDLLRQRARSQQCKLIEQAKDIILATETINL